MNKKTTAYAALILAITPVTAAAQDAAQVAAADTISPKEQTLGQATAVGHRRAVTALGGAQSGFELSRTELFKAACCNLGESFTTNPSVDVNYTDAATGARQIRLLGLSGTYVQMLTENVPDFRGAAAPYGLGYVPGPWMQSIQVSKGSASVKNGYESITGQINVEYLKPQAERILNVNLYGDTKSRIEANFDANVHLNPKLSTGILAHYENNFGHHDEDHDGFLDKARVRQYNVMNRWAYVSDRYIFQAAVSGIDEERRGGQTAHAAHDGTQRYVTEVDTRRAAAFAKNAFIFDKDHGTNLALILSATYHDADALYGRRFYDVRQKTGYASLIFETDFTPVHKLSAGLSLNHDYYNERYRLTHDADAEPSGTRSTSRETVPGAYAQYTLNLDEHLVVMAGLRADHSSLHGTFLTPRFHVKYAPTSAFALRLAAGKGYRTVHPLAEMNYLLASNRRLDIAALPQEEAWNYGISTDLKLPLFGHMLTLTAEYYFTNFREQVVADYDADVNKITLHGLDGHRSYSHTAQLQADYTFTRGLTATAAFRYNNVRQYSGGRVQEKPLTSRYKGLLTLSYKTPLELWQFDVTATLNGGGRLPYNGDADAPTRFSPYASLNAQVTRWFRHWSVYVGGENLTGYRQKNAVLGAGDPWGERFDATQVWGPVHGAMAYTGLRFHF